MDKERIVFSLYDIGAIKFGSFKLKSGINSPIYIDLRLIISYPKLLSQIANEILIETHHLEKECICGVPYTALPIATALSLQHNIPMVMRRKEIKDWGTRKVIEGAYDKGNRCLVIEDLITSGSSIFETIAPLEEEGLIVKDAAVLIDREQGGRQNLAGKGYQLHAVFKLSSIIETLQENGKISPETMRSVLKFLEENQVATKG